jgi:hypothetical protein
MFMDEGDVESMTNVSEAIYLCVLHVFDEVLFYFLQIFYLFLFLF